MSEAPGVRTDSVDDAADRVLAGGPGESLIGRVRRGLAWSVANNFVARLGNFVAGIVLARLLVPEDYGVFATGMVVLAAALSMNELGVSLAIVRWKSGVDRIAPTVVTLAAAWSAVVFLVVFLGAPRFAEILGSPDATPMIRVMAVCVLIDAVACVPAALMTRLFMQRERMIVDVVSFVVGTGFSIALAFGGFGAWAMVWGLVVSNIVTGVLVMLLAPRRFRPGFERDVARELMRFGLPLAGSSLLVFAMLNTDYVVVGSQLGPEQLGLYLLAFNLASWPVSLISVAIRRVSLAGFSRLADEPVRAGEAFARAGALVMAVTLPMCVLMAAYASPGIELLYGEKWLPAAEALRFLCLLGVGRVAMELAYDFLVAMGKERANLWLQVLWLAALVPALVVGARLDGIRGVSAAHALVVGLLVMPVSLLVLRSAAVSPRRLAAANVRPVLAALLVGLTAWPVLSLVDSRAWVVVTIGAVVALFACVPLLWPLAREFTRRRGD